MRGRSRARKPINTRSIAAIMALSLCLIFIVGGTIAWLTDSTDPVKNTFTAGDINIELDESDNLDLKMVPGKMITKDPTVTVDAGSEACWLFVKIEKSSNFDDFMTYAVAAGWTALDGVAGVFCREVSASSSDQSFAVIEDDQVAVEDTVTKSMLSSLTADIYPTLTFTAYAVQKEGNASAAVAWAKLN